MKYLAPILLIFIFFACKSNQQWSGQGPINVVPTEDKPIETQVYRDFDLGDGFFISNKMEGGRLNDAKRVNDTLIEVMILPENQPINPSPWYAFKMWSEEEKQLWIRLTYPQNGFHRYYPKINKRGLYYKKLDSAAFHPHYKTLEDGRRQIEFAEAKVWVGPDTLWIAAQDFAGTAYVERWKGKILENDFVEKIEIGQSKEGRPLEILKIGEADDQKMLMAISLQHPPEIPGFLALKSFVETLCEDSPQAKKFRSKYNLYVMPLMNPDGVARGHWRHNVGGVDTNRDWINFNQPEPKALAEFMESKVRETGGEFVFAADFHATWEDIFYTINEDLDGNHPGLIPKLIKRSSRKIPGYDPNIRPSEGMERGVTSSSYFFFVHGAEAMTFEVGDNTPRRLIRQKGETKARELMRILNRK